MELLIGFALGVFISLIFHEHMMRAVLDRMGIRSKKDIDKLLGVIEAHKPPTRDDQDKTVQQIKVENIKGRLYAYTLPEMQFVGFNSGAMSVFCIKRFFINRILFSVKRKNSGEKAME